MDYWTWTLNINGTTKWVYWKINEPRGYTSTNNDARGYTSTNNDARGYTSTNNDANGYANKYINKYHTISGNRDDAQVE
jgi:hypothetical protein